MIEGRPSTSYSERQRFEFTCPSERTVEARILLGKIEGARLVPPREDNAKKMRFVLAAGDIGEISGTSIEGVAKSKETFHQVLETLAVNEIAGYSRATQILMLPRFRSKEEKEALKKFRTDIEQWTETDDA